MAAFPEQDRRTMKLHNISFPILIASLLLLGHCSGRASGLDSAAVFFLSSLADGGSSSTGSVGGSGNNGSTGEGSGGGTSPSGGGAGGPVTSPNSLDVASQRYAGLTEDQAHAKLICSVDAKNQTDALTPAVTYPAIAGQNVPVNSSFVVYFNKPLDCPAAAADGKAVYGQDVYGNPLYPFAERVGYFRDVQGNLVKQYRPLASYYRCECNRLEVIPVRNFIPNEEYFMEVFGIADLYGQRYATYDVSSAYGHERKDFIHFKTGGDCAANQDTAMGRVNSLLADKTLSVCSASHAQDEQAVPLNATVTFTFNQDLDCRTVTSFYTPNAATASVVLFGYRSDGTTALEKFNYACSGNTLTITPCMLMGDSHYEFSLFGYVESVSGFGLTAGITTKDPTLGYLTTNRLRGGNYSLALNTTSGAPYTRADGICAGKPPNGTPDSGSGGNGHGDEYDRHERDCHHGK